MKLTVTGHRPKDLGGYNEEAWGVVYATSTFCLKALRPSLVYTGMAQGWDQACAQSCIDLGIPFIAVVPFAGQANRWSLHGVYSQEFYYELLHKAEDVIILGDECYDYGEIPHLMRQRNAWMVREGDELLALWNSKEKGGTYHAVRCAVERNKHIYLAWARYLKIKEEMSA